MHKLTTPRVPEVTVIKPTPVTAQGWHPTEETTKQENIDIFNRRTHNQVVAGKSILYVMKETRNG